MTKLPYLFHLAKRGKAIRDGIKGSAELSRVRTGVAALGPRVLKGPIHKKKY